MPNQPTNASLTAIVTELESLRNSSAITPQKYLDIFALLPERSDLPNEHTSGDAEPDQVPNDLSHTKNENLATGIAKAAQNPNHPAYPRHPKHEEWSKAISSKFANAAIFGAGQVAGADMMQDAKK